MAQHRYLKLTTKQRKKLTRHRDHDNRPYVRERCSALLKIADGTSAYTIARQGLLKERDPDTVYHWLDLYEREGLAGIVAHQHGGAHRTSPNRREELLTVLRQGPGEKAKHEVMLTADAPPPSRWTLRTIRVSIACVANYSLTGVWRVMQRQKLQVRSAQVQHYSPDPDYVSKEAYLLKCLREGRLAPRDIVLLFLDEMGYYRWPAPAISWALSAPAPGPVAEHADVNNQQWRIIGALNALNGQVHYLDDYIVGRKKVIALYDQIDSIYNRARRIYVVQDNWNIHQHPDVLDALKEFPRIEPVWLPTYAPWLNPIEKLWRWLRQDVLKMHRLAGKWTELRQRVRAFLNQFAKGSKELLRYVGLLGHGKLARAVRTP